MHGYTVRGCPYGPMIIADEGNAQKENLGWNTILPTRNNITKINVIEVTNMSLIHFQLTQRKKKKNMFVFY